MKEERGNQISNSLHYKSIIERMDAERGIKNPSQASNRIKPISESILFTFLF